MPGRQPPPDRQCTATCPPRGGKPERRCPQWSRPGTETCVAHAGDLHKIGSPPPERQCTAHRRDGERCPNWALKNLPVCRYHGGSNKRSQAAAEKRRAEAAVEAQARKALATLGADPVDNPLVALSQLAGEVLA